MTQEEKQLLLVDLCARLPYGVNAEIVDMFGYTGKIHISTDTLPALDKSILLRCKPYLRPMSSTTDEEERLFRCELPAIAKTDAQLVAMRMELFLKGHLDFNHLIDKGLALEAPEEMYKTE